MLICWQMQLCDSLVLCSASYLVVDVDINPLDDRESLSINGLSSASDRIVRQLQQLKVSQGQDIFEKILNQPRRETRKAE